MARHITLFLLLSLLLLGSCSGPDHGAGAGDIVTVADSIWDGEMQVTGTDARFMACGSGIRYALSGPGMDTVLNLYRSQQGIKGQTMKVWLNGHLAEQHSGQHDTAFLVSRIEHIDATLSCPPRPSARVAGRYTITLNDPMGARTITMDLFPNGEVTSYTKLPDHRWPLEQDGRWGLNSKGEAEVYWPAIDKRVVHAVTENTLTVRPVNAPKGLPAFILRRSGAPVRMEGAFGRVVHWMAAVAARQGTPLDTNAVSLTTPLDELFPAGKPRTALLDSAITWYPLNAEQQRVEWAALSTVRDLVGMKRNREMLDR